MKKQVKNEKKGNTLINKLASNNKILIVSIIAVLLVLIIGTTFAYFVGSSNISNTLNITTKIENNNGTFIATGSNIELNVTRSLMSESASDDENAIVENNGLLNIEYLSGTDERIICRYDINYEWVSEEDNNHTYTITNNDKKEFTYEIYDESNVPIIANGEVNSEVNFSSSNDRTKHNLKTLYISNSSTDTPTHQEYRIEAKFYNLEEDQNQNADKEWKLQFYVDNVICGIKSEIVYDIVSGNNVEIIKGDNEGLEIRIDADYSKFENGGKVYIDGELVDESNYTSRSGSTVIGLFPGFIDDLSLGDHTGKVEFTDGGISEFIFSLGTPTVSIDNPITNDIYKGRTLNLTATTNSKTLPIEWVSDNPSVATVDNNGLVTGVGVGIVHIKAKIGNHESEEIEINVKTNIYNVNITDKGNDGTTLGTRTDTCTIFEDKTITPKDGGYSGYTNPNSETITCQEENNITLTYASSTYNINITDKAADGTTLGTRTEECTYGESTLVPVGSYTGYSSPTAESITCGVTNTKTYTYTPAEYTITVTDKNTDGETLGTRSIACTYGVSTTVNAGSYTGYASPSSTSTVCSTTNNIEMTYTANTYDVVINDVSSNGSTLGTRTESCTYGKSYTPTVTSYTGHSAPSTSSITCNTSNTKTYTYTAKTYNVTINDKKPNGTILGTRSGTCTYGTSYTASTATNGTYTGYNAPSSVSSITCSSTNTVNITYVAKTNMSVTINYKDTTGTVIHTAGSTTCTYDSSKTVSPITINGYTSPSSKTFTCGSSNTVNFIYEPSVPKIPSITNCNNPKFIFSTDPIQWGSSWSPTPEFPSNLSNQLRDDYQDVIDETGRDIFLGFCIDSNNIITNSYVCAIHPHGWNSLQNTWMDETDEPFCLEGSSTSNNTYNYNKNKSTQFEIFGESYCEVDKTYTGCSGGANIPYAKSAYNDSVGTYGLWSVDIGYGSWTNNEVLSCSVNNKVAQCLIHSR